MLCNTASTTIQLWHTRTTMCNPQSDDLGVLGVNWSTPLLWPLVPLADIPTDSPHYSDFGWLAGMIQLRTRRVRCSEKCYLHCQTPSGDTANLCALNLRVCGLKHRQLSPDVSPDDLPVTSPHTPVSRRLVPDPGSAFSGTASASCRSGGAGMGHVRSRTPVCLMQEF